MSEPKLTDQQTKCLASAQRAVAFHRQRAGECNDAGLPILAREHHWLAGELEKKIDLQLRAFRDDSLLEPDPQPTAPPAPAPAKVPTPQSFDFEP